MHGGENGVAHKMYLAQERMTMLSMCSFWHMVVGDYVRRCAFVLILCSVATCCIDPLREGTSWMSRYM